MAPPTITASTATGTIGKPPPEAVAPPPDPAGVGVGFTDGLAEPVVGGLLAAATISPSPSWAASAAPLGSSFRRAGSTPSTRMASISSSLMPSASLTHSAYERSSNATTSSASSPPSEFASAVWVA